MLFRAGDRELWWPATGIAKLFMLQLRGLEQWLGETAGLAPGNSDEIEVDLEQLGAFLVGLDRRMAQTNHSDLHAIVAPLRAILQRLYSS